MEAIKIGSGNVNVELNKFAKQATSSLMINYEDTYVLVSVVEKTSAPDCGFFPLTVNYEEKLYAFGKIPGNYNRRESRPSTQATLAARLIDRPLRPMFADHYHNEVQIVCSVISYDPNFEPDILSITGASLALNLAPTIPFNKPISGVCVGMIDGEFIINPTLAQKEQSKIELKMAGSSEAIVMVEASSQEVSEEVMVDALMFGHEHIKKLCAWQQAIIKQVGVEKIPFTYTPEDSYTNWFNLITNIYQDQIKQALQIQSKEARNQAIDEVCEQIINNHPELIDQDDEEMSMHFAHSAFDDVKKNVFRRLIIDDKHRVDGRQLDEIRPLSSEIDLLPRPHGSSLFTRGETQSLATVTLGVMSDQQTFDGFEPYTEKPFLLHYNFPPYSVGETGRMGAPGRREIGHGHLGELAISQVIPNTTDFPYTIRVVSEILESNGSSSQATICAASLALMDAGVPIKEHVAGIAMGLIKDEYGYSILTDIQGLEDHLGDMDFKVAGTSQGICSMQMDIKIDGIDREILTTALAQAKKARLQILEHMNQVISTPRSQLSEYAPKTITMQIKVNKIKDVIGKGGETINKIIDQTGVKIDIEEDGQVYIYGVDQLSLDQAQQMIETIVHEYEVGQQYKAVVKRIEVYGAFVSFNDQEALLHISDLSKKRVDKVEDVINLNDEIEVEIVSIDEKNRIKVKLIYHESQEV